MADEEQQQMQEPMEGDEEAVPVVIDRSKLTPNMRHYLAMSKLHSQNEYSKGSVLIKLNFQFLLELSPLN